MKIRKIVSAAAAVIMSAGLCMQTAFAIEDGQATYCFDTDAAVAEFVSYGSAEQTGMTLTHTVYESKNGNGSVLVSENLKEIPEEQFGGFYIEAETLGLESFKNCTIEMSVKLCEGAEDYADNFALYSDGIIWLTQSAALTSDAWTTITLAIPDGAANTKVGFTIPTFKVYSGDILYIDDFAVTDANGTVIANRGDYELKKLTTEDAASTGQNIGLTILLVVLILAIVGGIGLIVSAAIRRFS